MPSSSPPSNDRFENSGDRVPGRDSGTREAGEAGEVGEAGQAGEAGEAAGEADVIQRAQRRTVITAIIGVIEVVGAGKGVPLPIDVLERTCEGPALTLGEIRPLVTGTRL